MSVNYLIIGASAAGVSAATKLRQLDANASITIVTEEADFPYNKCFLADYLSGLKDSDELLIKKETFFEEHNITIKFSSKVVGLIPEEQKIVLKDSSLMNYDKLLLAVGGSVSFPPIEGLTQENGALPFYTLQDTQAILKVVQKPTIKNVVILGAGLSGLECADSIFQYVDSVTIVERESHVLYRQIPYDAAEFLQARMKKVGVSFLPNTTITKASRGFVTLSNKQDLKADMVICALGTRPNGWLAHEAGLETLNGAIVTDDFLTTSDPNIFAAGDVALVTDKLTGKKIKSCSWPDALMQGMVAASNMAGVLKKYPGTVTVTSSAFFGVKFFVCGNLKEKDSSYNSVLSKDDESFSLIFLKDGVVKGFLLIGKTSTMSTLKRSLLTEQECELFLEQ